MENDKKIKISTPMAIVVAGFLIMVGLIFNRSSGVEIPKTISEQVGVKKEAMAACMEETDVEAFTKDIFVSVEAAMRGGEIAGTPYSIIVGANGVKTEIRGADSYENVKKAIDEVIAGKVTTVYKGEAPAITETDHILGDTKTAQVTIIEYSDFECPFCKAYHATVKKIVEESNGNVAWVYRHYPLTQLHANALEKAVASECITKLKGNEAFWKYADLLFGMIKTSADPVTDQL